MDLGLSNTLLAGDPRLVDHIVGQVKSQGIFDQFRKECIADVDTKPAYQNLRTRVEGSVNSFLKSQTWKPDMNKNQLRETLRKHIHDASFLDVGVERIVDQVVNPKIYSVFMPQIEDVVYKFLGLERPKPREKNGPCNLKDLLPKDLDPVSPESDRNSLKDESLESMETTIDEYINGRKENSIESKPQTSEKIEVAKKIDEIKKIEENKIVEDFKKIEEINKVEETKKTVEGNKVEENKKSEENMKIEETRNGQLDFNKHSMDMFEKPLTKTVSTTNLNISFRSDDKTEEEEESPQFEPIDIMNLNESNLSNDSHLSGISELTSHRSRSPDYSNDFSRDNFDLSHHDQDSQLSKVSSDSRLSIITDFGSSNQAFTPFMNVNEESKDRYPKDNFRAIRDIEEGKYKENKFNFEAIKNKESPQEKEKDSKSVKSLSSRENSRDEADSVLKEKNVSKDAKEKSESRDLKEKSESRDGKERSESRDGREKSESSKSRKDKSDSRDSRRQRDRKKHSSSSGSKHSKSRKERDQSQEKDKTKEVSNKSKEERREKDEKKEKEGRKEKEEKREKDEKKESEKQEILQDIFKDLKDIYKEKIRELREKKELTEKEKLNKDSKTSKDSKEKRDSSRDKKDYKKDYKTSKSSDRHEKSSKTKSNDSKDRKRDDRRHSKESRNRSSRNEKEPRPEKEGKSERSENKKETESESQSSKEKKQRDDKKSKSKDDHSSLRKNSNDRRSTDRDGSNGSSSKSSQKNTSTGKSVSTTLTKETNNTNNSSGDTSDGIEDSQGNDNKLATTEFESQLNYKPSSSDFEYLYPEKENSLKTDGNSNETCLPLKKRPFCEDSSSPSSSGEPKLKKPKFAKNFQEAKRLMKIRKQMEKQNSDEGLSLKVKKINVEETESESLSNSPPYVEDITKVPDEERVQIIEVPDEECEEPYSEELSSLTLEETSMIILQGEPIGQSDLMQSEYKKESKLSLMERSIRKSLDEMMSDQKLVESSDVAANAERTIETEAQKDLKEREASEIEQNSSEKNSKESLIVLKEITESIEEVSGSENNSAVKFEENKVEENLEKLEKGDSQLNVIPEEDESLNSDADKMKSDNSKIVSKDEKYGKILSSTMELELSVEMNQSTEDLIRNMNSECSTSTEEISEDIKKSKENIDEGNNSKKNLEMKEGILLVNDKKQEKEYPIEEEVCLYFEPDNERYLRFTSFLESFEKDLDLDKEEESLAGEKSEPKSMAPPQLKRKRSSSPLSDILLHNKNNNNDGIKEGESEAHDEGKPVEKKKKLGRPKKQRPSLSSFTPPGLLNGENFVMPLSPESDVSATSEKTPGQPVKEEKSRQRSNQRYSSDDLYKPRPLFSSSSRRNRRANQT